MPKSSTRSITRRKALIGSAAGLAAPMFIPRSVLGGNGKPGANNRIGVGLIGLGHRAMLLSQQLPEAGQMMALCDCNLAKAEKFLHETGVDLPVHQDHRDLLDRSDIDAVIVATQAFQRVTPCIDACLAGKDVYAEKPLTLDVHEGRALVNVVRKTNRILQVGTQQRSMEMNRVACDYIRNGGLGKIREVRAVNYVGPKPVPAAGLPAEPMPKGMNWDRWLNQAAMRPYTMAWRDTWQDMRGGEMTNWGAHGIDQVQWALGADDTGPVETWPITPGFDGANFHGQVGMRYANGVKLKFVLPSTGPNGGGIFIGEKGKIEINRNKYKSNPQEIAEHLNTLVDVTEEERKWSDELALWQARWHMQNWLDCIRSRKRPKSDVEIAHRSVTVCHLANITRFVDRKLRWDPAKEQFEGDDEANGWVARVRRQGYELPDVV